MEHHRPLESIKYKCCITAISVDKFQIGPNLDLSKTLNNGYRPLLLRIEGYPGHFGFLLIKIHILPIEFVTIRWIKKPQNSEKPVFLMPSFKSCTKQQCAIHAQTGEEKMLYFVCYFNCLRVFLRYSLAYRFLSLYELIN